MSLNICHCDGVWHLVQRQVIEKIFQYLNILPDRMCLLPPQKHENLYFQLRINLCFGRRQIFSGLVGTNESIDFIVGIRLDIKILEGNQIPFLNLVGALCWFLHAGKPGRAITLSLLGQYWKVEPNSSINMRHHNTRWEPSCLRLHPSHGYQKSEAS